MPPASRAAPKVNIDGILTHPPPVLKLCLQGLVCLTIGLRALALFGALRRAWRSPGLQTTAAAAPRSTLARHDATLADAFRQELRRRGLLNSPPRPRIPGPGTPPSEPN